MGAERPGIFLDMNFFDLGFQDTTIGGLLRFWGKYYGSRGIITVFGEKLRFKGNNCGSGGYDSGEVVIVLRRDYGSEGIIAIHGK